MKDQSRASQLAKFLIPSIAGVLLFMIPVRSGFRPDGDWTVVVKMLADRIRGLLGYHTLAVVCLAVLSVSALMTLLALIAKPRFLQREGLLRDCFVCKPVWAAVRVLGCACMWLTYLYGEGFTAAGTPPLTTDSAVVAAVAGADQGALAFDLIIGLVVIFLLASFLLPLLLDFGLLEYVGARLTRFMRPVFKVPGRAAVDCITSWIGDGTLGVMLTCNQYEGGYYSAKEATIIATLFSAVSITFSLVVLDQVRLTHMFGVYYLLICFVGVVCAIVCPRIWPLCKKPESYLVPGRAMPDALPEGCKSSHQYGIDLALRRVSEHEGVGAFFLSGAKNCLTMWCSVLPTVAAIGTAALLLANFTPIFQWLGLPFYPLLKLLGVPEARAAANTMVIGFTDMFTPAILISTCPDDMTRFIVAVISITQVLFLDEVGGLILSSKLPVSFWELFVILIERTLISILIVVPVAHLLF